MLILSNLTPTDSAKSFSASQETASSSIVSRSFLPSPKPAPEFGRAETSTNTRSSDSGSRATRSMVPLVSGDFHPVASVS